MTNTNESQTLKNRERIIRMYSDFHIDISVLEITNGYQIDRYCCQINDGSSFSKVSNLSRELTLTLAVGSIIFHKANSNNENSNIFYIDVPLEKREQVLYAELNIEELNLPKLSIPLGAKVNKCAFSIDLFKTPGVLVAGTTGSGKSMLSHVAINKLMQSHSAQELQCILIDPKRIELIIYRDLPHLLRPPVTKVDEAREVLNWVRTEIERRKELFYDAGVDNFESYQSSNQSKDRLPFVAIFIDEFSDLMHFDPDFFEESVKNIVNKGIKYGLSIWIATSRPSENVYPRSLINVIPIKIIGIAGSERDSLYLINRNGAENLLGCGDMLVEQAGVQNLERIQVYYLPEEDLAERIKSYKYQALHTKESWWQRHFVLLLTAVLFLFIYIIPLHYSNYKSDSVDSNNFDIELKPAEVNEYKYESRLGNSAPYSYNYEVSGYGDLGYVYGNIDIQDKYGEGYIYTEDGEELWIEVEWADYGVLDAYDEYGNYYELEVN